MVLPGKNLKKMFVRISGETSRKLPGGTVKKCERSSILIALENSGGASGRTNTCKTLGRILGRMIRGTFGKIPHWFF